MSAYDILITGIQSVLLDTMFTLNRIVGIYFSLEVTTKLTVYINLNLQEFALKTIISVKSERIAII